MKLHILLHTVHVHCFILHYILALQACRLQFTFQTQTHIPLVQCQYRKASLSNLLATNNKKVQASDDMYVSSTEDQITDKNSSSFRTSITFQTDQFSIYNISHGWQPKEARLTCKLLYFNKQLVDSITDRCTERGCMDFSLVTLEVFTPPDNRSLWNCRAAVLCLNRFRVAAGSVNSSSSWMSTN